MSIIKQCEFRGRRARAAVVICPPNLSDDELRMIGRWACWGERDGTVWFWDDPAQAPEMPPTVECPMSDEQAEAAVAIYIGRTGLLCRAMPHKRAA